MSPYRVIRRGGAGSESVLPPVAAWEHLTAREGFEILFIHRSADGHRFSGGTVAVQDGVSWRVDYEPPSILLGSPAARASEAGSREAS